MMKVAYVGGVKFSHELLSTLLSKGWDISVVFSYDDSKKNFYSDIASFDELTKKYHIPHIKVNNINDLENIKILHEVEPDLILVMGWSQLLKDEIIKIPKLGVIGSHPTELPKYRGRSPIPWTILKDLKESALTFFYIDEGIDAGDIIDQRKFDISDRDDATTIYEKVTSLGKKMIIDNLELLLDQKIIRTNQDPNQYVENWPKRTMDDGKINWNHSSKEIDKLVRASTFPYPGAFTKFKTKKLIIWKSEFIEDFNSEPGILKQIHDDKILVGTGNGTLKILKASYQNKHKLKEIFSSNSIGIKLG